MYDPNKPDAYAERLADVNQSNEVTAVEDIRNDNGVLLISKGHPIKSSVAQKLLDHKLTKPLESSIHIENAVSGSALFDKIQEVYFRHPDTDKMYSTTNIEKSLKELCKVFNKQELLKQKITVASLQTEANYESAVFCAVLTTMIASAQGADTKSLTCAFLAGLCHDIGLLHLDPAILHKEGAYTSEEWRAMQGHTAISHYFLKSLAKLPKEATDAVLQHHERCDGTGYPSGKLGDQLCMLGQTIALGDSMHAIRMKQLEQEGRTFQETLPFLQLNTSTYFYENFQSVFTIIKHAEIPPKALVNSDNIEEHKDKLLFEMELLLRWSKFTSDLIPMLKSIEDDKEVEGMLRQIDSIWDTLKQSGLLSDGINRWIEHVAEEKITEAFSEMEEIGLMQRELLWQYKNLCRRMAAYLSHPDQEGKPIVDLLKKVHLLMSNLDNDNPDFDEDTTLDIGSIIVNQ